jgi:hypothetical protein
VIKFAIQLKNQPLIQFSNHTQTANLIVVSQRNCCEALRTIQIALLDVHQKHAILTVLHPF